MSKITKGQVYAIIESLGKARITKGQVYAIIDDYSPPLRPRRVVSFTRWADHSNGPKRYWRLLVLATIGYKASLPSNEYAGLRYLGMAENMGDPDIIDPALYLTNGAASPTPTGEDGRNVFRGPSQTSTGAVSADSNGLHWFRWDFGSGTSKTISEIILGTRSGYYGQQPARFILQASADDSTWTDVFSVDLTGDETYVPYENRDFRFSAAPKPADPGSLNPHRYWRVRVKTYFDSDYICINSAKFYTDENFMNPLPNTGAVFNASSWMEGSPTNGFNTGNCISRYYGTPWVMEACYPEPVVVDGFSMKSRDAYGQAPKNMSIDYSDDGQNWYEAWNTGDQTAWALAEQRFFARPAQVVPGGDSTTPLTVPLGKVSAPLTAFPMRIDLSHLPQNFWDNVAPAGANIRVTKAGGAEVPVDVVAVSLLAKTGEIFAKVDLLPDANNTFNVVTVANGTAPLPSDPYGRHAVWADYECVHLMRDILDRTANDRTMVFNGNAGTTSFENGFLILPGGSNGGAAQVDVSRFTSWTMGCSASLAAINGTNRSMLSYSTKTTVDGNRETMLHRSTRIFGAWNSNDTWLMSTGVLNLDERNRFNETFNGTVNRKIYKNGALSATDTGTTQRPRGTGNTTLFIGVDLVNGSQRWFGRIGYVYLRQGILPDEWIAAEYLNWETPANFYTV